MAKTSSNSPNVALEKIAQLLNNIVDEGKFIQHLLFNMAIRDETVRSGSVESSGNACIQRLILKISTFL